MYSIWQTKRTAKFHVFCNPFPIFTTSQQKNLILTITFLPVFPATLADCYFADNDLIAIGTIKALRLRGYKVPEQVAIVGFDNISEGRIIDPSLTSISIPRHYMGQVAARELLSQINEPRQHTCKIEVSANLVKRFSV